MKGRGFSLLELLVMMALLYLMVALAGPPAQRAWRRAALSQAALRLYSDAQRCQELAAGRLAPVGLLFDVDQQGVFYVVVADGNGNGVSRRDYLAGRDPVLAGPVHLRRFSSAVQLGLPSGRRLPAPGGGGLLAESGLSIGRWGILSFSPTLGASPGTVALSTQEETVALRLAPMGSLRLWRWSPARGWRPWHF